MRSTPRHETITLGSVTGTVPPSGQHNPPVEDTNTWHPQGAFYLNQMAAPPIPPHQLRRPWPTWVVALIGLASVGVVVTLGLLGAAVKGDGRPAAGVGIPTSSSANSPTPTGSKDSAGTTACAAVRASNNGPNAFSQPPAAMAAIAVDGMHSPNPFIRSAAEQLRDAARAAVDANGTDPMSGIKMGTAALNLETTCIEQWYYPRPS